MKIHLEHTKLITSILSISKKAGKEILEIYNQTDYGITYKEDNSPLTLADKASNTIIENSLNKITPDIPILS
tara:strand:+ start:272 stop:487 length:216 start_codon:yes stop_codon:yes gene_type:complete